MSIFPYDSKKTGGAEVVAKYVDSYMLAGLNNVNRAKWFIVPSYDNPEELSLWDVNIVWVHLPSPWINIEPDRFKSLFVNPYIRQHVSMYVVQSEWHKNDLITAFDISPNKIFVMPNPVELSKCFVGKKNTDRLKLLYTSQIGRGFHILDRALKYIKDDNFDVYVNVSSLDTFVEKDQFSDRYIYRERLPRDEYFDDLSTVDILPYPCIWEETFCLTAVEAMASGARVVTTNIGALPDTTGGFARTIDLPYVDFSKKGEDEIYFEKVAKLFAKALDEEIKDYRLGRFNPTEQINYVNNRFNDGVTRKYWEELDKKLALYTV